MDSSVKYLQDRSHVYAMATIGSTPVAFSNRVKSRNRQSYRLNFTLFFSLLQTGTISPKSQALENMAPERMVFGLPTLGAVTSQIAITFEGNGIFRPARPAENGIVTEYWLGDLDSNQGYRSQSPGFYH